MKKKIVNFIIFPLLTLAAISTAIFYILQMKIINADFEKINQFATQITPESEKTAVILSDFSKISEDLILAKSDFVEANLSDMKIYFYRKGILEKEFTILAKGDPQGWGGSSSGLYRIIGGNKASYSLAAEVYMPFALHYYGKYYIHGEPYYPGGGKRYTDATGGCIQLSDKDAQALFNLTEVDMPVVVVDKENDTYKYRTKTSRFPAVSAESYLVADLDSGFIFAEKDRNKKWPIASLSKLMTAVVVAENVDLRNSIQIDSRMLTGYGSTEGLTVGKNFRVVELFYPLLTESSNDAAQALSYFLGHEKTIKLMNEKAKAISMSDTDFVSPGGYSPQNISNTEDLFYLARYILNNRPPLLEISKGKKVQAFGEVRFENLDNKNLFFEEENFIGGKTGYLTSSKNNGLFIFRFQDAGNTERKVAIIILGSPNLDSSESSLKGDTEKIVEWLRNNYFKI